MATAGVRARSLLVTATLSLAVWLGGCARGPSDHGAVLPADTVFWASAGNLPALEASLRQHGLWEPLVAELGTDSMRVDLQRSLGIELSADPGRDLHEFLAALERLDVSLHPPRADQDPADFALLVRLTARKEEPVADLAAAAARHATGTRDLDGTTIHVLPAGDEDGERPRSFYVLREGRDLLVATEPELLAAVRARLQRPPDPGLAGTAIYGQARDGQDHDLIAYMSPEFPGASPSLLRGPAAPSLLAMPALVEQYGAQAMFLGADHGLTHVVARTVLPPDSKLLPLLTMHDGGCSLLAELPRDTYALLAMLVQADAEKAALARELLGDVLAAVPLDESLPLPGGDPLAMIEGLLGFDLVEAASLVTENVVAAAHAPQYLVLMRTASADHGQQLLGMLERSPVLAFLPEQGRREVGGVALRTFTLPLDQQGRLIALGRRQETVMLLVAASAEELDGYLTAPAGSGLAGALPAEARKNLSRTGHAWSYLDLAGLAGAHGLLDDLPADLPVPMGERLRRLVMSAHTTMPAPGVQATVMELSGF